MEIKTISGLINIEGAKDTMSKKPEVKIETPSNTYEALLQFNQICSAEQFSIAVDVTNEKIMVINNAHRTADMKTVEIVIKKKDGESNTEFNIVPTKEFVLDLLNLLYKYNAKTQKHLDAMRKIQDSIKSESNEIRELAQKEIDTLHKEALAKIKDLTATIL